MIVSRQAWLFSLGFAGLVSLLVHAPAAADAIDGEWCLADGQRMSIRGPAIVTPAGTATTGNYTRHAFTYTAPAADPAAGTAIAMRLIDDDTLHLSTAAQPLEVWRRCEEVVS